MSLSSAELSLGQRNVMVAVAWKVCQTPLTQCHVVQRRMEASNCMTPVTMMDSLMHTLVGTWVNVQRILLFKWGLQEKLRMIMELKVTEGQRKPSRMDSLPRRLFQ